MRAQKVLVDYLNKFKNLEACDFGNLTLNEMQAVCIRSNLNSQSVSDALSRYLGLSTSSGAPGSAPVPPATASMSRISKSQILPVHFLSCLSVRTKQLCVNSKNSLILVRWLTFLNFVGLLRILRRIYCTLLLIHQLLFNMRY